MSATEKYSVAPPTASLSHAGAREADWSNVVTRNRKAPDPECPSTKTTLYRTRYQPCSGEESSAWETPKAPAAAAP
jgi:hypothetical protein